MPLILTQNEITLNDAHDWNDVEGVQYHYPTKYRNKVKEGERFKYYQGVHRADGQRGEANYFGMGKIGEIWQDPNPERQSGGKIAWFCSIDDYERFPKPVAAKANGEFVEQGPKNLFRDGVRVVDVETFEQILTLSGFAQDKVEDAKAPPMPDATRATLATNLLLSGRKESGSGKSWFSRSKSSKKIGDWAEELVLQMVREIDQSQDHKHRAALGEKPGWDIDYVDAKGVMQRVEVKGTQAAAFRSIEITANELSAAKCYGPEFSLYLVARCMSDAPSVQVINNPYSMLEAGDWNIEPTAFRVRF